MKKGVCRRLLNFAESYIVHTVRCFPLPSHLSREQSERFSLINSKEVAL